MKGSNSILKLQDYGPVLMGPGGSGTFVPQVLTTIKQSAPAIKGTLTAHEIVHCWNTVGRPEISHTLQRKEC